MTIDLSKTSWRMMNLIVQYCWKNDIELEKIREIAFLINRYPTRSHTECKDSYVFDIPDNHFIIMTLLGIFND